MCRRDAECVHGATIEHLGTRVAVGHPNLEQQPRYRRGDSGNGREKVKLLSDYEVDPTALGGARDYLLFQPAGNSVRFFSINTSIPLSTVSLRVRYVSRTGHAYDLLLSPGAMATIKVEFRAK